VKVLQTRAESESHVLRLSLSLILSLSFWREPGGGSTGFSLCQGQERVPDSADMSSYMEDLQGFLLDEQVPVTYSYLSSTLSVPADTAKR
jgi:hypothetical protein